MLEGDRGFLGSCASNEVPGFLCGGVLGTVETMWSQGLVLRLHLLSGPAAFSWLGIHGLGAEADGHPLGSFTL